MSEMSKISRRALYTVLAIVLAFVIAAVSFFTGSVSASAKAAANGDPGPKHAQEVVSHYLSVLDADMANPSCNMSNLSTVYTSDASLRLTGGPFAPGGPFGPGNSYGAQSFQGVPAITGTYTKLCHAIWSQQAGAPSWTQDAGVLLSPQVLNSYEHISVGGHLTGRCMHIFTISGDRISSLDWSVYA
jgi:hypothetical protein